MYSSIQDKIGICCDCTDGVEKPLIAGRCKYKHYKIHRDKIALEKIKAKNKFRSLKSEPKNKEILLEKGIIEDENLELFFKLAATEISKCPWCLECGAFIGLNKVNDSPEIYKSKITIEQIYRNATAHIFAKAIFHSVRAHPKNYLPLPASCGCHNKTHRWDTFVKMKCWDIAVAHIKEIYPYIDDSEKKNIPSLVWKEIPDEYEKYYGHPLSPKYWRMTSNEVKN
jgi:hypothetical protein